MADDSGPFDAQVEAGAPGSAFDPPLDSAFEFNLRRRVRADVPKQFRAVKSGSFKAIGHGYFAVAHFDPSPMSNVALQPPVTVVLRLGPAMTIRLSVGDAGPARHPETAPNFALLGSVDAQSVVRSRPSLLKTARARLVGRDA